MQLDSCCLCKWTNVNLLNLGTHDEAKWVCQGCCKRMLNALERLRDGDFTGTPINRGSSAMMLIEETLSPNRKTELESLVPHIKRVLETGKPWEDLKLHYPAEAAIKAVLSIKGVEKSSFDTNGCQWDWWQHFKYKGKEYTLSGSGYYGGHSFYLSG